MSSSEATTQKAPAKRRARRRARWWHGLPSLLVSLVLAAFIGVALYLLMGRPINAPDWLRERIQEQVARSFSEGSLSFDTLDFVLENQRNPRVRMSNVRVLSPEGGDVVGFAEMRAGLSLPDLLSGRFVLTSVDLSGVFAQLQRQADGSVVLSGGLDFAGPTQRATSFGALLRQIDTVLERPELQKLQSAQIQALTLRLEDERLDKAWTIDGGRIRGEREDQTLRLTTELALLSGGGDVATVEANYQSDIGSAEAQFGAVMTDFAASDIAALAAPLAWLDVLRAPISGAMRGGIDAQGNTTELSATLSIAEGVIQPTDTARPVPFQSAQTYFAYDPADQVMRFDLLSVESDWISAELEGQALLQISDAVGLEALVGQISASTLSANPANFYDAPIAVESAVMDFRVTLDPFTVEVGQFFVEDKERMLIARGELTTDALGWRYAVDAQVDGMSPQRLLELWPEGIASRTRDWIALNLRAGELTSIDFAVRDGASDPANVYLSFDYDQAEIQYARAFPTLQNARGSASLLDGRFVVQVDAGTVTAQESGALDMSGSSFIIPDITVKGGAPGVARINLSGPLSAALSLLDEEPLQVLSRADLSASVASGTVQAEGTISLPLMPDLPPGAVQFDAVATASRVKSTQLIPGRTLEAGSVRIVVSNDAVSISSSGTLDGVPVSGEWRRVIGQGPQPSTIEGTVELSQRTVDTFNLGLPRGYVRGRGQGSFRVVLPAGGGAPDLQLQSNLSGLQLAIPPLGWSKASGTRGTLAVNATLGPAPRVNRIALDAAGLSADGSISLRPGGGLDLARFDRVRLGGWLDAPVDLAGTGVGRPPRISVRGGSLDLTRANLGGGGSESGQNGGALNLALDRLQVTDTIAITGLRGDFTTSGGLDGTFTGSLNGAAPISGQVIAQGGRSAIRVRSNDAGRAVAAAGLLRQARGGALKLTLLPVGQSSYDGTLEISGTRVQDAPAIAALLNALSIVGLLEQMGGSGIHFQEVEAAFRLSPSQVTVTRASAVGPSMGISMDGTYDPDAKWLNMRGVISPIYLINGIGSLFSRRGEGLIGFNYRLEGPTSQPRVSVDPLSALAPGMFRDIFRRPPPEITGQRGQNPSEFEAEDEAVRRSREERQREIEKMRDDR